MDDPRFANNAAGSSFFASYRMRCCFFSSSFRISSFHHQLRNSVLYAYLGTGFTIFPCSHFLSFCSSSQYLKESDAAITISKRCINTTSFGSIYLRRPIPDIKISEKYETNKKKKEERYCHKNCLQFFYKSAKQMQNKMLEVPLMKKGEAEFKSTSLSSELTGTTGSVSSFQDSFQSVLSLGDELRKFYKKEQKKRCNITAASMVIPSSVLYDNKKQTLGSVCSSIRTSNSLYSDVHREEDHGKQFGATKFELQQVGLLTMIQQLLAYYGRKTPRGIFFFHQSEVAHLLLCLPRSLLPTSAAFVGNASLQVLQKSLERRGAKTYLDLLCHHHLTPRGRKEWISICHVFSAEKEFHFEESFTDEQNSENVAVVPLLPSALLASKRRTTKQEKDEGQRQTHFSSSYLSRLAVLTTATEAVALLRWSRQFTPEKHISSLDVEAVLRKWIQANSFSRPMLSCASRPFLLYSGGKVGNGGPTPENGADATTKELVHLWESAKRAEKANSSLAKLCGVTHTHHTSLQIEGSTLVTFPGPSYSRSDWSVEETCPLFSFTSSNSSSEGKRRERMEERSDVSDDVKKKVVSTSSLLLPYGSTKGYNEALIMGRWQWVLHDIIRRLTVHVLCSNKMLEVCDVVGETERKQEVHNIVFFKRENFFQLRLAELAEEVVEFLKTTFIRAHALVPHKILVHAWEIPRLPKDLRLFAPVSQEEESILRFPPTRGLVVSGTSKSSVFLDEEKFRSVPSSIQQIRQRLWTMKHLPPHFPLTLVRFESSSSSSSISTDRESGKDKRCFSAHSSHFPLPVLDRSPSRELLCWLLTSINNLAASLALYSSMCLSSDSTLKAVSTPPSSSCMTKPSVSTSLPSWEKLLQQTRTAIEPLLFSSPHPCYVALNEHSVHLFSRLSCTCAASLYSSVAEVVRHPQAEEIVSEVLEKSAHYFFQPPRASFYNENKVRSEMQEHPHSPVHYFSEDAVQLWTQVLSSMTNGLTSFLTSFIHFTERTSCSVSSATDVKVSLISPPWMKYLRKKVSCLRNFHFSLYVEALVATASGKTLLKAIKKETLQYGPPVLGPESAAAMLTALILHFTSSLVNLERTEENPEVIEKKDVNAKYTRRLESVLHLLEESGCRHLLFSFPSDKFHPVSTYFKGIFHPSFFRTLEDEKADEKACGSYEMRTKMDPPLSHIESRLPSRPPTSLHCEGDYIPEAGWLGSEALLTGRSLRLCEPYPTTTTERFFKLQQNWVEILDKEQESVRRKEEKCTYPHRTPQKAYKKASKVSLKYSPPPLRIRFAVVDVYEAVKYFFYKGKHDVSTSRKEESSYSSLLSVTFTPKKEEGTAKDVKCSVAHCAEAPYVVAKNLPYGLCAVYKPAGVACTMHAHYPTLISFLQHFLPWESADGSVETPLKKDGCSSPSLYQQGLVNRIDVGTSGIVLIANKKSSFLTSLSASSVFRYIQKFYQALVRGPFSFSRGSSVFNSSSLWYLPPEGTITSHVFANGADASLTTNRFSPFLSSRVESRLPVGLQDQRQAITHYKVLRYYPEHNVYHVEVSLVSGRRHQIRQHFASIGCPLVGDSRYGSGEGQNEIETEEDTTDKISTFHLTEQKKHLPSFGLKRPALHSSRVEITCSTLVPASLSPSLWNILEPTPSISSTERRNLGEKVVVECPLPLDMQQALFLLSSRLKRTKERISNY